MKSFNINSTELQVLQKIVYEANLKLFHMKLAIHTWGNVSAVSADHTYFVIKPSGVGYDVMQPADMVPVSMANEVLATNLNPSSDTPTHAVIYLANPKIKAIVHTHSPYGVAWAQAGRSIPCFGTTHADNFYGSIPCTRALTPKEIEKAYEYNTGLVIKECFQKYGLDYLATPGVLVREHGPFVWSTKSPFDAIDLALTLEEVAKMATYTISINPQIRHAQLALQKKHYFRKHGDNAYYGQTKKR